MLYKNYYYIDYNNNTVLISLYSGPELVLIYVCIINMCSSSSSVNIALKICEYTLFRREKKL